MCAGANPEQHEVGAARKHVERELGHRSDDAGAFGDDVLPEEVSEGLGNDDLPLLAVLGQVSDGPAGKRSISADFPTLEQALMYAATFFDTLHVDMGEV